MDIGIDWYEGHIDKDDIVFVKIQGLQISWFWINKTLNINLEIDTSYTQKQNISEANI